MKTVLALLMVATAGAAWAAKPKAAKSLHAAIAYHQASGSVGWASDRPSSRDARVEALRQCGRDECVVVAEVSRDCAALVARPGKFAVQKGATQQEAETKALSRCGADCRVAAWVCTR